MQIRTLVAASTAALIASSGASLAQETMTDGLVMVNVAGSMVEVPVSIAAEACGMDAAAVIEAAGMVNTDARGADMVAAEPNTDGAAAEATAEPTTEAAVGAGAATTETEAGTASEAGTELADAGIAADAAAGDDMATEAEAGSAGVAADMAMESETETADAGSAAAAEGGPATPVCEIDQATADQYGIPAAGETAGG